jgi:hypothetical protein
MSKTVDSYKKQILRLQKLIEEKEKVERERQKKVREKELTYQDWGAITVIYRRTLMEFLQDGLKLTEREEGFLRTVIALAYCNTTGKDPFKVKK